MATRANTPVSLSPGQAVYVLERLARDRVISTAEIAGYLSELPREIADLEARLYRLRGAASNGGTTPPAATGMRGKRRRSSAVGLNAKRLGGRFAGLIRRLPARERKQFHAIKEKDGVEAAIRALQERRKA